MGCRRAGLVRLPVEGEPDPRRPTGARRCVLTRPSRQAGCRRGSRDGRGRGPGRRHVGSSDGGHSLAASRSSSSPSFPSTWRSSVSQTSTTPSGPPGVGRQQPTGRLQAQLVDPQRPVGDRDGEGRAEERLEIEARPGLGDRHRLEHAPPRSVQEDTAGLAHLGADAAAGREVGIELLRAPRTSRSGPRSCSGPIARRTRSAWARIWSRRATSSLTPFPQHIPSQWAGEEPGGVAGVEDAGVDLEAGEVG